MPKALVIKAKNALNADVMPLMLGDAIHLDAEEVYTESGLTKIQDTLAGSVYAPANSGLNPAIVTEDGFKHIQFTMENGLLLNSFSGMLGATENTTYMVVRITGWNAVGAVLRWNALPNASSDLNKSIILRQSASSNNLQFMIDPGPAANVSSVMVPRGNSNWAVICFGWSTVNNQILVRFGNNEVTGALAPASAITGNANGPLSIAYRDDTPGQAVAMSMRKIVSFNQYHNAAMRQRIIDAFKSQYGI
ncbi:hypothetical protein HWC14_gp71 [Serratia phage Parlo]|uniref:Uncharacterized protein n=1 Tax=Serratia phage Parlo TaxID=2557554 RepID=A0A482MGE9_9CAUD|nr:hypothetical protein HWC14_gp71 [Serratia phage Parlo]QBQ72220.1 hypothetical protein CPT_Parlo_071 [Serratia phage Parlo]